MMINEPTVVLVNRSIIGNSNISSSGRHPCGQQPQIVTELSGKRRRSVVVRSMRQRQIMLRIEKINVNHDKTKAAEPPYT